MLEIELGSKSLLGHLLGGLRRKIRRYTIYEPNILFTIRLEEWLYFVSETEFPLLYLEKASDIYRIPFILGNNIRKGINIGISDDDKKYDIILFYYSIYGIKPKYRFIERALEMLIERL